MRFQELLEKGGHIAIGGIFNAAGDVVFYAVNPQRFTVQVYGKNVEEVDRHAFRISVADDGLPVGF